MYGAFRDTLAILVRKFFQELKVLYQDRAERPRGQRVLVSATGAPDEVVMVGVLVIGSPGQMV